MTLNVKKHVEEYLDAGGAVTGRLISTEPNLSNQKVAKMPPHKLISGLIQENERLRQKRRNSKTQLRQLNKAILSQHHQMLLQNQKIVTLEMTILDLKEKLHAALQKKT